MQPPPITTGDIRQIPARRSPFAGSAELGPTGSEAPATQADRAVLHLSIAQPPSIQQAQTSLVIAFAKRPRPDPGLATPPPIQRPATAKRRAGELHTELINSLRMLRITAAENTNPYSRIQALKEARSTLEHCRPDPTTAARISVNALGLLRLENKDLFPAAKIFRDTIKNYAATKALISNPQRLDEPALLLEHSIRSVAPDLLTPESEKFQEACAFIAHAEAEPHAAGIVAEALLGAALPAAVDRTTEVSNLLADVVTSVLKGFAYPQSNGARPKLAFSALGNLAQGLLKPGEASRDSFIESVIQTVARPDIQPAQAIPILKGFVVAHEAGRIQLDLPRLKTLSAIAIRVERGAATNQGVQAVRSDLERLLSSSRPLRPVAGKPNERFFKTLAMIRHQNPAAQRASISDVIL